MAKKFIDAFDAYCDTSSMQATEGTKVVFNDLKVERFATFNMRKACTALHVDVLIVTGLQMSEKKEGNQVLAKQLDKLIDETPEDLGDGDVQPLLILEARRRMR